MKGDITQMLKENGLQGSSLILAQTPQSLEKEADNIQDTMPELAEKIRKTVQRMKKHKIMWAEPFPDDFSYKQLEYYVDTINGGIDAIEEYNIPFGDKNFKLPGER